MATNHDDDASSADHGDPAPAESEARTTPDQSSEKTAAKPSRPAAKPGAAKPAKPPLPASKGAKPGAAKPSVEKRAKPAVPKDEAPEKTAPNGEADDGAKKETAVQTEDAVKGKKKKAKTKAKDKAETGVTAKPGLASFFKFSKAAPTGVWGVDLGQCALKAVRLEMIDGEVTATAFDYVEHPKILSQPDADPDELTREALQKFLSRNVLRGDTVAISVPGQSGLARFVKLPPVEEKKIPDIVRFEAKQQIPFNLDEVVWDYQKLGVGELAAGFVETEIGLFAMKRDMVNRYLQHFKDVGVEVHLVQMAPLALCNFVAYDLLGRDGAAEGGSDSRKHCVSALDIGADSSNLVITDGGRIIWQRPIPLGGNHFTRALTKDLKLTFAKAEHLKRNAVKSPDLKKILASLKPVLSDFVGEVQRSLSYFTNTHRDAQIEYMVGLGNAFRLPGLQRFLAEKLQMDVRKLGKMERLSGDGVVASATYTENILSFAVAYGLALQGLKRTKLQTNLLPGEIRAERAVRGKKPWAIVAAALLLLGLAGFAAVGYCDLYAYAAPILTDPTTGAEAKATGVAGQAKTAQDKYDSTKSGALKEEEAVKSIIAGQFERKNWLEMTHYLFAEALPRPDGSNLSPDAQKKYMDGHGQQAYEDLQKRWRGELDGGKDASGKPADSDDTLDPSIEDLVQVNVDYFDQRYCDDLGAAWTQIKTASPLVNGEASNLKSYARSADLDKTPEGRGWIVEIHGTTYYKSGDAPTFLTETLVDNIYRLSVKPGSLASALPSKATSPSPAPPPPAGAPAVPAKAAPPADKDAYIDPISNVVLFNVNSNRGSSILDKSVLDSLLSKTGGGTGGPSGMPGPAATNSPAAASSSSSSAPPTAAPAPTGGTGATGSSPATLVPRDGWSPLSGFMGAKGSGSPGSSGMPLSGSGNPQGQPRYGETAKPRPEAASKHTRTEFVIVFFWKEPTPSDLLRGEDPDAKPPAPAPVAAPPISQPSHPAAPANLPADDEKPLNPRDLGP